MTRRIHVPILGIGDIPLDKTQSHHARDVLRLAAGTVVEVFDDAGATASGVLQHLPDGACRVYVTGIIPPSAAQRLQWTIAAAVPKGDRADWMVEKLSELGASAFIPLATARSVVLPAGKNRWERWSRIATEAAKQSRRTGVMRVDELTPVERFIETFHRANSTARQAEIGGKRETGKSEAAWFLATEVAAAVPVAQAIESVRSIQSLTLFVGPEGGWTAGEISAFSSAGVLPVRLGRSILRIETAAVAAGAVVSSLLSV